MPEHLIRRPQPRQDRLRAAYDAFTLSREAMRCTPKTLEHYAYTVGGFVAYLGT